MIQLCYKDWQINGTPEQSLYRQLAKNRSDVGYDQSIDPFELVDMQKAVERIWLAIDRGERIVIFGDYDVDGITATAIIFRYLEDVGADVYFKLPNRRDDGYGITTDIVTQLHSKNAKLIITVDNGITATHEVEVATKLGIDVVITDHHLPGERLPSAVAVVDPKRIDDESRFKSLSGAGVALFLTAALEGVDVREMLPRYGDLAALGTVCDIMPLIGVNHAIVRAGLQTIKDGACEGIAALLNVCKQGEKPVSASTLGYVIGPRLNAAGRMDDPTAALSLLLSTDNDETDELAALLEAHNIERQKEEADLVKRLKKSASEQQKNPILVLWGEGYHEGILGLAASRIMHEFSKPTLVIGIDGDKAKGSGRSIPGFSLYNALSCVQDILSTFGGHELAAGFSLSAKDCNKFSDAINDYARGIIKSIPPQKIAVDGVMPQDITIDEIERLDEFAPFGHANPIPCFALLNLTVEKVVPLKLQHCRLMLKDGNNIRRVTYFGCSAEDFFYSIGTKVDIVAQTSIYYSDTMPQISLQLKAIRPSGFGEAVALQSKLFCDYLYMTRLCAEEKTVLLPDRDFVAKVFKAIGPGISCRDLQPLFLKIGEEYTGKTLSSLFALLELEIIQEQNGVIRHTKNPQKQDLQTSKILQGLQ